ncbi:MAG: hypothetical protein R3A10_10985 [Caldilineaceae bacterium]
MTSHGVVPAAAMPWLQAAAKPRFSVFSIKVVGTANAAANWGIAACEPSREPLSTMKSAKSRLRLLRQAGEETGQVVQAVVVEHDNSGRRRCDGRVRALKLVVQTRVDSHSL